MDETRQEENAAAEPAAAEQAEDVLQNGLVKEGSHRLGLAQAQGPQADALASG